MSGDDVSKGEMPKNPFSRDSRPVAAPQGDEPVFPFGAQIENGDEVDPVLTDLFRAASAPASAAELAGEGSAMAAFRAAMVTGVSTTQRRAPWRPRMITTLTATTAGKFALAAIAGGVSLGGASAAAFATALPAPLQNIAHHAIGAPAAHHSKSKAHSESPAPSASPSATSLTASNRGQCKSFEQSGPKPSTNPQWQQLITAAGGESNVAAFCTALLAEPTPAPEVSESPKAADQADEQGNNENNNGEHASPKPDNGNNGNGEHASPEPGDDSNDTASPDPEDNNASPEPSNDHGHHGANPTSSPTPKSTSGEHGGSGSGDNGGSDDGTGSDS